MPYLSLPSVSSTRNTRTVNPYDVQQRAMDDAIALRKMEIAKEEAAARAKARTDEVAAKAAQQEQLLAERALTRGAMEAYRTRFLNQQRELHKETLGALAPTREATVAKSRAELGKTQDEEQRRIAAQKRLRLADALDAWHTANFQGDVARGMYAKEIEFLQAKRPDLLEKMETSRAKAKDEITRLRRDAALIYQPKALMAQDAAVSMQTMRERAKPPRERLASEVEAIVGPFAAALSLNPQLKYPTKTVDGKEQEDRSKVPYRTLGVDMGRKRAFAHYLDLGFNPEDSADMAGIPIPDEHRPALRAFYEQPAEEQQAEPQPEPTPPVTPPVTPQVARTVSGAVGRQLEKRAVEQQAEIEAKRPKTDSEKYNALAHLLETKVDDETGLPLNPDDIVRIKRSMQILEQRIAPKPKASKE